MEIRNRLSIVELVGEYVQLKKAGQGFQGLCPFHTEKTPSFHVHPIKQCFHCFGCQKGGNIFTFLGAVEGLNFPEAVQRLAKRTGVILEETHSRVRVPRGPDAATQKLLAIHEWAAKYFHFLLLENKEYQFAADYLRDRGITRKTIEKFRIGVSPKGWSTLLTLMLKRSFTLPELIQAGLVIEKEGSATGGYDRFRGRLMFPICDPEGSVVGFGARLLTTEENQPKYLNSAESPLFSKRKLLYGFHENSRGIRLKGEAVIVEGYMDVVGLYECGVHNAVATMGTAMTEEHCTQLRAATRRVVTVFDPDSAGLEAWHRSVHLFLGSGLFAKDLSLPDGKDPDEFALSEGADRFYELCEKAPRQITKLLKEIASQGPQSEEQSSRLLSELTPVLVASRKLADRATLWDDISLVLKVSVASLKELADAAAGQSKPVTTPAPEASRPKYTFHPRSPEVKRLNHLDLEFFQAALREPEQFLALPKAHWLGGIKEPKIRGWLEKLGAAIDVKEFEKQLEVLVHTETDSSLIASASAGLLKAEPDEALAPSLFRQIAERIKARCRETEIKALSAQVKLTQRLGDDQEQMRLLERLKELRST